MIEQRYSPRRRVWFRRYKYLDQAARRKFIRFVWSGLAIIVLGIVLIAYGLLVGTYPTEDLLIGFGAIAVVVGLIRVLIGFIHPSTPDELPPPAPPPPPSDEVHEQKLEDHLFEEPSS